MRDNLYDFENIYIMSPPNFATGGPELLHQLAHKLKSKGKNAKVLYSEVVYGDPVHESYKQYEIEWTYEIPKNEESVLLVVPETQTKLLKRYSNVTKAIWWLSVDNYFLSMSPLKRIINIIIYKYLGSQDLFFFDGTLKEVPFHFAQSEYAKEFLRGKEIETPVMLSDYLNKDFLKVKWSPQSKENIVAFNPKKGNKFTTKIINRSKNINFVPIINMSREEVLDILRRSKVYIDFGFHPGKDRIPREAAYLGNCIISSLRGSAGYFEDLPINGQYKFRDSDEEINSIINKINDCLENYAERQRDFENYRNAISRQEKIFDDEVDELFFKARLPKEL